MEIVTSNEQVRLATLKIVSLLKFKGSFNKEKQLHIQFRKRMPEGNLGMYLIPIKGPINDGLSNGIHVIYLSCGLSKPLLERTLIHELTHLKQVLTGKLVWSQQTKNGPIYAFWKNEKLGRDIHLDPLYEDLPWEIEANVMEERLKDRV